MQDPPLGHCLECILPPHTPRLTCQRQAPGSLRASAPLWRCRPSHRSPGEGPHPREAGALPPPRPHPGSGNKVRRRREKADTQAAWGAGTMPAALWPQPQPRASSPRSWNSPETPLQLPPGPPTPFRATRGGRVSPSVTQPHSCPFLGCGGPSPTPPWCHLAPPAFGVTPPESFPGPARLARPFWGIQRVWVHLPLASLNLFPSHETGPSHSWEDAPGDVDRTQRAD